MKIKNIIYTGLLTVLLTGCTKQGPAVSTEPLASSSLEERMASVESEPEEVIFPDFNTIASIQEDGELYYGVIDGQGHAIVPFQYELVREMRQGYSARKKEKHGYEEVALDFAGNPADFDPTGQEWEYMKIGRGDFYRLSSEDYSIAICRTADDQKLLTLSSEGDFHAFEMTDMSGKRRLLFEIDEAAGCYIVLYDEDMLLSCSSAEAAAAKLAEHKMRLHFYGFFYDSTKPLEHLVYSVNNDGWQGYGIIDLDGNILVEPRYTALNSGADSWRFDHNMIAARDKKGMFGYIDTEGNTKIPFQYKDAKPFYKGYAAVKLNKDMIGIINKNGEEIWRSEAQNKVYDFSFSRANFAVTSDNWNIIKYDGTVVDLKTMFDEKFIDDSVYSFHPIRDNFFLVERRMAHDEYQRALLNPESSEWVIPLSEKQMSSSINMDSDASYFEYADPDGKILYNQDGKEVSSGYDRLVTAVEDLFLLEKGDVWYWYDEAGQLKKVFPRPEVLLQE